ncbi:MAG: alpha/beta hydrolase family protein [Oceanococcus sp.]
MHLRLFLISLLLISACNSQSQSQEGSPAAARNSLQEWPQHRAGENPPEAPAEIEAVIHELDAVADSLPDNLITLLFDPLTFGVTVRDLTDPSLLAFHIRASLAQFNDGSRTQQNHWYGHPDYNDKVAIVPVNFSNRYGTELYGEIILPSRGEIPPTEGPFPVILALQGVNSSLAVYRWWHQAYADAGYLVFAFDFSGQGKSQDEGPDDPGNNIEEAQDAITYLFEQSPVRSVLDASKFGVVGHSQGAITALGLQALDPRPQAVVAAAPIAEQVANFDSNSIPVMIQTGDHDGPIAPFPIVNPAIVRPVYEKLAVDRAFIVAEASSHSQHTNNPILPTSTWGIEIAALYSVAWMDFHFNADSAAKDVLINAHPHLSYLWDSEVRIDGETTIMRGLGPLQSVY